MCSEYVKLFHILVFLLYSPVCSDVCMPSFCSSVGSLGIVCSTLEFNFLPFIPLPLHLAKPRVFLDLGNVLRVVGYVCSVYSRRIESWIWIEPRIERSGKKTNRTEPTSKQDEIVYRNYYNIFKINHKL